MKIYIAATFREFDGSENDKIQVLFLESLMRQKFTNFELVTTTFGERSVKTKLNTVDLNIKIYEEEKLDYRFSLTKVLENAISYAEANHTDNDYFIIWTTCDLVFQDDFLESVFKYNKLSNYKSSVISHPHLMYQSIEDLENDNFVVHGPNDGIDYIGFSGRLIQSQFKADLRNYFYSDWGVFEHFLVAMAVKYNFARQNLFQASKARKISNDRSVNNENDQYFKMSLNKNWPVFRSFLADSHLSEEYFFLAYCNLKYKVVGSFVANVKYRLKFSSSYFFYYKRLLRRSISRIIPIKLKLFLKSILFEKSK
jgi:hypothetical protein